MIHYRKANKEENILYIKCKSCGKMDKNYAGYCQKCYTYFVKNKFVTYKDEVEYGKMSYVQDENSKQYSMPIL